MDNFFRHCQKFDGSPATDIEMVKLLKVTGFRIFFCVMLKRSRYVTDRSSVVGSSPVQWKDLEFNFRA